MHIRELIDKFEPIFGINTESVISTHIHQVGLPFVGAPHFELRGYQREIFELSGKVNVVCMSRQIGKTYTLGLLGLIRALNFDRQVTVFGATEYHARKVLDYAEKFAKEMGVDVERKKNNLSIEKGGSLVARGGSVRSGRGDSGDVILDEFAFLNDPKEFFEAVKPIISADPHYKMWVSSTPNGHNYFETLLNRYPHVICSRSRAHDEFGLSIFSEIDGREILPDVALSEAVDPVKYRQNYECDFDSVASELVFSARDIESMQITGDFVSDTDDVRPVSVDFLGVDVGRTGHSTVCWGATSALKCVRVLELKNMGIDKQANAILRSFALDSARVAIDTNGLGIGLYDILRRALGKRIFGVNANRRVIVSGIQQSLGMAVATGWRKYKDMLSIPPCGVHSRSLSSPYILGNKIVTPTIDGSHCDLFWAFIFCLYLRMLRDKVVR